MLNEIKSQDGNIDTLSISELSGIEDAVELHPSTHITELALQWIQTKYLRDEQEAELAEFRTMTGISDPENLYVPFVESQEEQESRAIYDPAVFNTSGERKSQLRVSQKIARFIEKKFLNPLFSNKPNNTTPQTPKTPSKFKNLFRKKPPTASPAEFERCAVTIDDTKEEDFIIIESTPKNTQFHALKAT